MNISVSRDVLFSNHMAADDCFSAAGKSIEHENSSPVAPPQIMHTPPPPPHRIPEIRAPLGSGFKYGSDARPRPSSGSAASSVENRRHQLPKSEKHPIPLSRHHPHTLRDVCDKYNVTEDDLREANPTAIRCYGLDDRLPKGLHLKVPFKSHDQPSAERLRDETMNRTDNAEATGVQANADAESENSKYVGSRRQSPDTDSRDVADEAEGGNGMVHKLHNTISSLRAQEKTERDGSRSQSPHYHGDSIFQLQRQQYLALHDFKKEMEKVMSGNQEKMALLSIEQRRQDKQELEQQVSRQMEKIASGMETISRDTAEKYGVVIRRTISDSISTLDRGVQDNAAAIHAVKEEIVEQRSTAEANRAEAAQIKQTVLALRDDHYKLKAKLDIVEKEQVEQKRYVRELEARTAKKAQASDRKHKDKMSALNRRLQDLHRQFAVSHHKSTEARPATRDLIGAQPVVGFGLLANSAHQGKGSLPVETIYVHGPAWEAGLRLDDEISQIGQSYFPINSLSQVRGVIQNEARIGQPLRVVGRHTNGEEYQTEIVVKTSSEKARQYSDIFFDPEKHELRQREESLHRESRRQSPAPHRTGHVSPPKIIHRPCWRQPQLYRRSCFIPSYREAASKRLVSQLPKSAHTPFEKDRVAAPISLASLVKQLDSTATQAPIAMSRPASARSSAVNPPTRPTTARPHRLQRSRDKSLEMNDDEIYNRVYGHHGGSSRQTSSRHVY